MPYGTPKKSVYRISNLAEEQDEFTTINPLTFNHKCYAILRKQKDLITQYNVSKKWDKYKKYMNDYELVFTSSNGLPNISKHLPISRSFFKIWEILADFRDDIQASINDNSKQLKVCCIAEGPGGFLEAIVKYRRDIGAPPILDKYVGMTLISQNKCVPNWKLSNDFIKQNNISLCFGSDGTGSLYNFSNIETLRDLVGPNACDLVTADGGFDYSYDFNEQEEATLPLLVCEVLTAFLVQKNGGTFVLKIFDISHPQMFQVLYLLYTSYAKVYITKPFSSRPANSEKYLVCCGFKGYNENNVTLLKNALTDLSKAFIKVPLTFHKELVYYNTHYTVNQTLAISQTLDFIDQCEQNIVNSDLLIEKIKRQLEYALRWCYKYNIPINIASLQVYCNMHRIKDMHTL